MGWIADITNWLMSIDATARLIAIGFFAVLACVCLIRFLNKNVTKSKINWIFMAFAVVSICAIVVLCIFQ